MYTNYVVVLISDPETTPRISHCTIEDRISQQQSKHKCNYYQLPNFLFFFTFCMF